MADAAPPPPGLDPTRPNRPQPRATPWVTIGLGAIAALAGISVILALTARSGSLLDKETLSYIALWIVLSVLALGTWRSGGPSAPARRGRQSPAALRLRILGIACVAIGAPSVLIGGCVIDPRSQFGQTIWLVATVGIIVLGFLLVRRSEKL